MLLVAAKLGGVLAERWRQPPVLGELLVGILLGTLLVPSMGRSAAEVIGSPALAFLAEIGVLVLLFEVGLEVDARLLTRAGSSAALVAVIGVVTPIALGWVVASWLMPASPWLVHLFVGATLAATSVGITARVLRDLGVSDSPESRIILGAAVLDDVLGLIVLAVVSGLAGAAESGQAFALSAVAGILLRAVLFFAATLVLGRYATTVLAGLAERTGHPESILVFGLALCFILAWVAQAIGLAAIVGAFAAGVMLDPFGQTEGARAHTTTLAKLLQPLSALFVPLFFILIGISVDLRHVVTASAVLLTAALVVAAIAGKLACSLGVLTPGASRLAVAIGMIPRGEVGLIFAGVGATLTVNGEAMLSGERFSAVVLMVLVTTLVAPPALTWAFGARAGRR